MKKIIALLLCFVICVAQISAFALHSTTETVNKKYANAIEFALKNTKYYDEQLDKDNIYIIEKTNTSKFKSGENPSEFYVAIPLVGTDDIAYSIFRDGEYYKEVMNSASLYFMENYMNTKIDEYIRANSLENVTEVVSTIIYGRTAVYSYRVETENGTYFIPYLPDYINFEYNVANDEECALEFGKAYKADDFVERLEKEKISYKAFREQQKKEEEERKAAEAEKEAAKYRPTISLDENGDEVIKVNGLNFDDILEELKNGIELMGFASNIKLGINTNDKNYITTYTWEEGCSVTQVKKFAEGLFDELKAGVVSGKPDTAENKSYCNFSLKHDEGFKSIKHRVEISVWKDGVKITINKEHEIEFKIKNYNAIIDYLNAYGDNSFKGFNYERLDENNPDVRGNIEGFTKTDVIEFELTATDNGFFKEIATPESKIKGKFEKYKENKYNSTYILTLSGDLGEAAFYTENQSSLSGEQEYFSNNIPVSFSNRFRFENGNLVEYKIGKESYGYKFKMVFKDGDIFLVTLDDIKCENLKYTKLSGDKTLSEQYSDKDKETKLREAGECADILYDVGLFKGTDKGYELEKGLTREEGATVLVRLLGKENKINADSFVKVFDDVDENRWSYTSIMYCYENNITKGTSINSFSPSAQIDAPQFLALLMRLMGFKEVEPDTAFAKSAEYGLLSSKEAEIFSKSNVFTRGEMVQIIYASLKIPMEDDTVFADYLQKTGVLTETDISKIE